MSAAPEVVRVEPTLSGTRIHTTSGAADMAAADSAFASGETVWLQVDPSHVRFVPIP